MKTKLRHLIIIVLTLTIVFCNEIDLSLRKKLFESYDRELRPVRNLRDPVNVNLTVTPIKLHEFNSKKGKLNALIKFQLEWCDENMFWKASEHGNITHIDVKADRMWLPQLNFAQEIGSSRNNIYDIIIENNCHVKWLLFQTIYMTCSSDVESYPLSKVKCGISLSLQHQLNSCAKFDKLMLKDCHCFKFPNWQVSFNSTFVTVDEFKFITITFTLSNIFTIFDITLLIFLVLMSILSVIVNLMPVDSGEKVTLVTTIFLANLVYLLEFKIELPLDTNTTPVLIVHQTLTTILNGLSTFAAILGTLVFEKKDKTVTIQPMENCKIAPMDFLDATSSTENGKLKEMLTRKVKKFAVKKRFKYDLCVFVAMTFMVSCSLIWCLSYMHE